MSPSEFAAPADIGSALFDDDVNGILRRVIRQGRPDAPIAFYGSSSFLYWSRICEDLGSMQVVNLGFGGGTYASALHYFDRLLLPLRPARIVLYFGENDISNDGLTAASTFARFERLIAKIEAACAGREHLTFVDVGSALIGENGRPMSRYFVADRIHITEAAYALWAKILTKTPGLLR
jgi:lysophospholipase L1-like esterase